MPRIIKSNGARESFNEEKLTAGMLRALEKRPVESAGARFAGHGNHVGISIRA